MHVHITAHRNFINFNVPKEAFALHLSVFFPPYFPHHVFTHFCLSLSNNYANSGQEKFVHYVVIWMIGGYSIMKETREARASHITAASTLLTEVHRKIFSPLIPTIT